ncbi:MAG: hypothetical protein KKI09_08570 [Spirochaetes bacterium]|nr:hypothetical protein [Spirochaetota bacterium]MBU0955464.1 hypothetical protein [Spirochaetota bacterium]
MKQFSVRFLRLLFGLFLYSVGIVLTIKAHIGYAPWDVFHAGLSALSGMSFGVASIVVGLVLVLVGLLLREKIGLGTVLNMVLIGVFLDWIMLVVPQAANWPIGLAMMLGGLFIISLASFFYLGSGFGAGPRDSLMVALTRKTRLPVGLIRGGMELAAVLAGWAMGGLFGAGTLLFALAIGVCIQATFRLLRFDPTLVRHENLLDTWRTVFGREERQNK